MNTLAGCRILAMQTHFKTEAETHPGTCPVSASLRFATGSMAETQTSIAAIWQAEADRLTRQSYRLLHKINGADIESIVQDALVKVLAAWESIKDSEHCRKLLATAVRNCALDVIRARRANVDTVDDRIVDPHSLPVNSRSTDATVAWLYELCADDTERHILSIWMAEGNQTAATTAEASCLGVYVMVNGHRRWFKPAWTALEVNALMKRLRVRMGVQLASARSLRFQTIGTLPGLHCQGFRSLGCAVLIAAGGRPETEAERYASRASVPMLSWDDVQGWVSGMEVVWSTR